MILGSRLSDKEKIDGLYRHNFHRCHVLPRAEAMPAMTWDPILEEVAQRYADRCPTTHNANRSVWYKELSNSDKNLYIGESIAFGFATLAQAIDDFASKGINFIHHENACRPGYSCGPYTQVVWANSVRLGCARPTGPCGAPHGDKIYVCNYAAGGNIRGKLPYVSSLDCYHTDACAALNTTSGCNTACAGEPAGAVCRAANPTNPCSIDSVCDGTHNMCPGPAALPDGTMCSLPGDGASALGVCFEGKCDPVHENVYREDIAPSEGDCTGEGCASCKDKAEPVTDP